MYEVDVALRANEEVMPEVVTNPAADMSHEVIAAYIICTSAELTTSVNRGIEANAIATDSSLKIRAGLPAKTRLKYCVEIIENRAVGLITAINTLSCLPGDVESESDPVSEDHISAEAGIGAALF